MYSGVHVRVRGGRGLESEKKKTASENSDAWNDGETRTVRRTERDGLIMIIISNV